MNGGRISRLRRLRMATRCAVSIWDDRVLDEAADMAPSFWPTVGQTNIVRFGWWQGLVHRHAEGG